MQFETLVKPYVCSTPVAHRLKPLQRGDRLESSESDVCRRRILTTQVDSRTVRVKICIMVVDP